MTGDAGFSAKRSEREGGMLRIARAPSGLHAPLRQSRSHNLDDCNSSSGYLKAIGVIVRTAREELRTYAANKRREKFADAPQA